MKKVMIGIFAHPDDEAFGPSGTLIQQVRSGADVHLLLITDGEGGSNPTNTPNLGTLRLDEWNRAAELIGTTSTAALHFPDGELSHGMHIAIGAALHAEIHRILESYAEPITLDLITFDRLGITGHLDHIAASFSATHQFYSLKNDTPIGITMGELWYYCLSEQHAPNPEWSDYYMPIASSDSHINRTIDVRDILPQKLAVMDAHISQVHDATAQKQLGEELLSRECFYVVS